MTDFTSESLVERCEKAGIPYPAIYQYEQINGKEEVCFTTLGTLLVVYYTWRTENNVRAKDALIRYCECLVKRGYAGEANNMFWELDAKDTDFAICWLKDTFEKYIEDELNTLLYVLNGRSGPRQYHEI